MDNGVSRFKTAIATIIALVVCHLKGKLRAQIPLICMAIFVLLGFDGCVGQEYDPGGSPTLALAKMSDSIRQGREVAIRGTCNSSCALKLAAGKNLCVSPRSEIGVHEVRNLSRPLDYAGGVRNELWTGFFEGMLPACARDLFNAKQGFTSGRLAMVSGGEILRACPTIRACAPR